MSALESAVKGAGWPFSGGNVRPETTDFGGSARHGPFFAYAFFCPVAGVSEKMARLAFFPWLPCPAFDCSVNVTCFLTVFCKKSEKKTGSAGNQVANDRIPRYCIAKKTACPCASATGKQAVESNIRRSFRIKLSGRRAVSCQRAFHVDPVRPGSASRFRRFAKRNF